MARRVSSLPFVIGGSQMVIMLAFLPACGTTGQRSAPAEDPNALVIPPIGADASAPIAADPPPDPADTRTALTIAARDPRMAKRRPRSRALVLTEAQGLERLLDSISQTAPERPLVRRRVAESYNELAYTSSGRDAVHAREKAIEHYTAIKNDHPQFAQMDEVSYYLGLAYELNGDKTNARRSYYDLIARTPSSKLIPLAYFAFGEMFFVESASDPSKIQLARQAFTEVLKYPPADNPIYAEALLRTGETHLRMGDDAQAKETFARLRRDFPDSDAVTKIPAGR